MDASQWYHQLPQFTRYWLTATVALSLLGRFEILPLKYLYLSYTDVVSKFELWRIVTSLFVYPLFGSTGFHFLINCYFITQYSGRLERDQFGRSPADYLYLLLIIAALANVASLFFSVYFLMDMLVVAITYIWCNLNKDVIVTFWFGTRFRALYLPWVLAGMELIFQGSVASLTGIFIGHFYYFLKFQYPQDLGGQSFLDTPRLFKRYIPDVTGGTGGFGVPPANRPPPPQNAGRSIFGDSWGRGNTLGF